MKLEHFLIGREDGITWFFFFEEYLSCSFNEVSEWNRKER